MTTRYAAFDDYAIHAVGRTPEDALTLAQTRQRSGGVTLSVLPIAPIYATMIEEVGFCWWVDDFEVENGMVRPAR